MGIGNMICTAGNAQVDNGGSDVIPTMGTVGGI